MKSGNPQIDLWALAESYASGNDADQENSLGMSKLAQEKTKTLLFVGEKKTGKSSLISKFFGDNVKEDMGETIALDYKFGKLM
jgi:GTPase SAR1 family protein